MINVVDGRQRLDTMRWGMPGPVLPSKPRGRVTNVRNTASGHWQPWLAGPEVVVGKEKNRGGRCIVPASAFAEPDRNTAKPVINRWFGRADGLPFSSAGVWREWLGDRGTKAKPGGSARSSPRSRSAGAGNMRRAYFPFSRASRAASVATRPLLTTDLDGKCQTAVSAPAR